MIDYNLDRGRAILHIRPTGPLHREDFDDLASIVDPYLEESGALTGLILEATHFSGWEDLSAVVRHFQFIRNHHKKIKKVAVVTDSLCGKASEHITSHFVAAEIKHFPAGHIEDAEAWIGPDDRFYDKFEETPETDPSKVNGA